jgi:hypothetical protein
MKRWWADPAVTRDIITSVDDRDPQQAMATAVLAAHSLQREALAPLTGQTLVDAAAVTRVLVEADLSPVADAVARVSRSSMGEAADEYGRLVAEDWRQQSVQSAQDVLARWVGQGMAWPTAVQRLSGVVGVPVRDLGRTVEQLKAPMPDLVATDHGDRALLAYASRIAARQPEPVGKNLRGAELFNFNRNHPRDQEGRFSEKSEVSPGGRLERLARRKRRRRRLQRRDRVQARNASAAATLQSEAVDVFGSSRQRTQDRAREARPVDYSATRTFERKFERKFDRKAGRARVVESQVSEMLPNVAPTSAMRLDTQAFIVIDRSEADALILSNTQTFNVKGLRNLIGSGAITAYSYDVIQGELLQGMRDIESPVVIEFNTVAATDAGPDSFDLADDAEYKIQDSVYSQVTGTDSPYQVMDSPFRTRGAGSPAFSGRPEAIVPMISVGLANEGAFQRQGADLPMDRQDRINRYNRFGDMEKALTGAELTEFNENHPRDEDGRFADKPAAGRDERVARRQRRRRRQRRVAGRLVAVQQQSERVNIFNGPTRQKDQRGLRSKESEVDWSATRTFVRTRQSDLSRLSRAYLTRPDAKAKYDFANAQALMLDDMEFMDLLQVDIDDQPMLDFTASFDEDISSLVSDAQITGVEALREVALESSRSRMRNPTRPLPAQEEYFGYRTYDKAAQAALEYIAENDMELGTTMSWDAAAAAEPHADTGETLFFPKRIGYEPDESRILVFGSKGAIDSLRYGSDPNRLKRIPAETFSELLALRVSDESLEGVNIDAVAGPNPTLPNPLVRAYWYEDGDD